MRAVTKKWLFLKFSSLILIPLMLWFIINFVSLYDKNYLEIINFLSSPISKFFVSLFLIFAYFFSALSIVKNLKTIYMMKKSKMPQTKH